MGESCFSDRALAKTLFEAPNCPFENRVFDASRLVSTKTLLPGWPRFGSVTVRLWNGLSGSGFRFRRFLWGRVCLCFSTPHQRGMFLVPVSVPEKRPISAPEEKRFRRFRFSETGRARFRRVRFQSPNSVSFWASPNSGEKAR